MSCRTARIGAVRAWPTVATDTAAQDRVEALEREVTTLRAQLATERDLADDLRDRIWQLEDEVGGYRIALAETTVERDRLRRDAEQLAAEYADAISTGVRLEDEADELRRQVDEWQQAAVDRLAEVGRLQSALNLSDRWLKWMGDNLRRYQDRELWPLRTTETLQGIQAWAQETFGREDIESLARKLLEESAEFDRACHAGEGPAALEELADIYIILARIRGYGLAQAIDAKMTQNRARQWERQADGTWHHVETAEVRDA